MAKYRVEYHYSNGTVEIDDEVFDTEEEACEYAEIELESYSQGGEILEMSNPGDYPYDEDDDVDFEIIEVDE